MNHIKMNLIVNWKPAVYYIGTVCSLYHLICLRKNRIGVQLA
jgi:hypothetical protein